MAPRSKQLEHRKLTVSESVDDDANWTSLLPVTCHPSSVKFKSDKLGGHGETLTPTS